MKVPRFLLQIDQMRAAGPLKLPAPPRRAQSMEEALKWYQLAADQDYDWAQECVDRVESALQNAAEDS